MGFLLHPTQYVESPFKLCRTFTSVCSIVLGHGSPRHRDLALEHLLCGLLEYATNEQGIKSITKALKEGGKDTLDRIIRRMCEPAKTYVLHLSPSLSLTNLPTALVEL